MNLCQTGVENWKIGFVWFTLVRVCGMKEKYETKQTLHRWCAGGIWYARNGYVQKLLT